MDNILEIKELTKYFHKGTPNQTCALNGLSLSLTKGDFVTIIGSNGAGKSTLFNAISGNFLPDGGRILLDDNNITYDKEYKRASHIGRIFQDTNKGTAPTMTIEENLALAYLRTSGKKSIIGITKQDRLFFREKLATLGLGLEDRMTTKVGQLSGGQRQGVALLMSTIVTPKLLLLDEHTAALDPSIAEKVLDITKKIVKEQNITCMMITHSIPSALTLGNKTVMMDGGKIVYTLEGSERDEMTVPKLLEVFKDKLNSDRMLLGD